ncbi:glycosyl hydrolase family 81-domain-containing protein [Auriculariales sp. MPI-PUGE-AT-0066]|nr:glycosyl hydrolase family 81-domain-containing protein [Auriculariales sp. MPI-PUGE-AT-0066]
MAHSLLASVLCALIATSGVQAALPAIGTSRPVLAGGNVANLAPPGTFFQDFKPPYPTNNWWVAYGAPPNQSQPVGGPFPYQSSCVASGIRFGISTKRDFDGTSIHQPTQLDWSATFAEHSGVAADHKTTGWDLQRVTVHPYITLQYAAATPLLTSLGGNITSVNGVAVGSGTTISAAKFTVVSPIGTYLIYSLNGNVSFAATATTLRASAPLNGVLRMVLLANATHQTTLDTYAPTYPTAVNTDYTFSGDSATVSFTYTVTGTASNLLMLTFPHHRLRMSNAKLLATSAIGYLTTTGWMYGNVGNVWTFPYTLSTIDFNAPRAIHSSCTTALTRGVEYEINNIGAVPVANELYYWGGTVAAKSRLALIADQLGRSDLRDAVVSWLKSAFASWTDTASTAAFLAYETGWGGVVDKASALDPNAQNDFGNGYYNDHHFHYGYFLAAASVIAKFDASWLSTKPTRGTSTNKELLDWIARDIANPSTSDPYFTVSRTMDWFAGHSWASGIANGAGGRDQESIGEAINGYYGALLYGTASNNTNLRNFARLLVAVEQEAARVYWQMDPAASSTGRDVAYPEQGMRNLVTIGNVMDWQAGAWLFWGAQKVQIAAIQILPVTPINEYLYVAPWVNNMVSYAANELADGSIDDAWKSVIYLALSNVNPQDAAQRSTALMGWGSGNTYSNQVYFMATRPNSSGATICPSTATGPEGTYFIQDVSSGKYVVSTAGAPDLLASATSSTGATSFKITWQPGSSLITSTVTNKVVTADQSGKNPITALRDTASTWESFKFTAVSGTTDQYIVMAGSNKMYLMTGASGGLINSVSASSGAAKYRLVSSTGSTPSPTDPGSVTGSVYIQDVTSGKFISVTAADATLHATAAQTDAAVFVLASVATGGTSIQRQANGQYVSADTTGTSVLVADRATASGWETFNLVAQSSGTYLIQATSNKLYLQTVNGNIINSGSGTGAQYRFVSVGNPVGTFSLQVVSSGQYVTAPVARETLIADTTSASGATKFVFAPYNSTTTGSGTIQSTLDSRYVSVDTSGTALLYANRATPSTWETFLVRPASAAGTYTIQALSNNAYVVSSSTGLSNSAQTVSGATIFRLA